MLQVAETVRNEQTTNVGKLVALAAQLAALLLMVYYFQLESQSFFRVAALTFGGFIVHYFLPVRYRLPFFFLLSLAAIGVVFGVQGLWLVAIGLALIGICHLPIPLLARSLTLMAIGVLLAFLRAGRMTAPWSSAIWPILASMFMFRLILYLYDSKQDGAASSIWQRLSYFFLLPNVCFPLFPVVDYKTFRHTYYNEERHRIYQVGVQWILRGLLQLVLYRMVYYYLSMAPVEVQDAGDLARYVVSGFLLYLRISGQFHVIVGMLRLFGFNLPETHHLYFLSTSFTDFWRRINIYWKDFMMKTFFYPAFFKLRKGNETAALLVSTALVFAATWVLHAYQWFWIRGSYLLAWNDVLFWTILAVLVMVNTVYEAKYGRTRQVSGRPMTVAGAAGLIARTFGTFVVLCVLWSLWTSASVAEFIAVWRAGLTHPSVGDARLIPAAILALVGFGALVYFFAVRDRSRIQRRQPAFALSAATTIAAVVVACVVCTPELYARYIPSGGPFSNVPLLASAREVRLSGHDRDMLERGYYEDLLSVQSFNNQLWELYSSWPINWSRLEDTGVLRLTGDFLEQELAPSKEIHFRNATLRTNRWGMRDQDYPQQPPAGALRFELVGSSHVMGYGVDDDQTFDALLERRLNAEMRGQPYTSYEVLNLAVDGYTPLQELFQLETRDLAFRPHVVLYVAHWGALFRTPLHLVDMVETGVPVPYEELREILRRAGIDRQVSRFEAERRLVPYRDEILSWTYRRMVTLTKAQGALPVWVYLPQLGDTVPEAGLKTFIEMAKDAGFVTISLEDCFAGHDQRTLEFGPWDHHPNFRGHELIAKRLYEKLQNARAEIFAPPPTTASISLHTATRQK